MFKSLKDWVVPLMGTVPFVFALVVFLAICATFLYVLPNMTTEELEKVIREDATVTPYKVSPASPEEVFTVVESPKEIKEIKTFKQIILRRERDQCLIHAVIGANREVRVGEQVRLLEVKYRHTFSSDQCFSIVE